MGYSVAVGGSTAIVGSYGGNVGTINDVGRVDVFYLPMGSEVCAGQPNSAGNGAKLEVTGFDEASWGFLRLTALGMPPGEFAMFLAGTAAQATPVNIPGSQGQLCLGGSLARLSPIGGPADGAGTVRVQLPDLDLPTNPPLTISAGQTWYFQGWYRDHNPAPTSNFTSAVGVPFR